MAKKKRRADGALATNNKARYNYAIAETYEAGLELTGTEIKSVRASKITIGDGFIQIRDGQAWLDNVHISPFEQGNRFNHDPLRSRRLLLHKKKLKFTSSCCATRKNNCTLKSLSKTWVCKSFDWCCNG